MEKENRTIEVIMMALKKSPVGLFSCEFLGSECASSQWSKAPALEGHTVC